MDRIRLTCRREQSAVLWGWIDFFYNEFDGKGDHFPLSYLNNQVRRLIRVVQWNKSQTESIM